MKFLGPEGFWACLFSLAGRSETFLALIYSSRDIFIAIVRVSGKEFIYFNFLGKQNQYFAHRISGDLRGRFFGLEPANGVTNGDSIMLT